MKNLPIIVKFLSIMGIFGLFAVGVAFYSTSQMRMINDQYKNLMEGKDRSALYLARSGRSVRFSSAVGGHGPLREFWCRMVLDTKT